jgi:very-short-patch-repair endonuclease
VLVEYDGWQHERDAWQRQKDHLRREALEAAGWLVIVVTTADMRAPKSVAARVARALMSRGYPN